MIPKSHHLTPIHLRLILSAGLFVIIGAIAAVFYFSSQSLSGMAVATSHANIDAAASSNNLAVLKKLQSTLQANQLAINNANLLSESSSSSDYQTHILNDLQQYANQTGLTISEVDFSAGAAAGAAGAAAPTAVSGATPTTVNVTLTNPVNYIQFLLFIRSIELNLPKLQIARLELDHSGTDRNTVAASGLSIQMYLKP